MLNSKIIGDKITLARKNANLSQAALADQLFISPQAVGKWERGESLPDVLMLHKMSKIFQVDLNYFIDEDSALEETEVETTKETKAKPKLTPAWDLSNSSYVNADFSGLKNLDGKFSSSNLQNCKFNQSDLSALEFKGNHISACDFSSANLSSSKFSNSYFDKCTFLNSNLRFCEMNGSHLQNADFTGTDLSGSTWYKGGLENVVMKNVCWQTTSMKEMYLSKLTITGKLKDCSFDNCSFRKVTFENALLENTLFKDGSLKKIVFINCQADRLTYAFLKNGKAKMDGIRLIQDVNT